MMQEIAGKLLTAQGWKVTGGYNGLKKSITVFAPHTAHVDFFYGKLAFTSLGIRFRLLTKKEMFFFPMSLIMRALGAVPVRGVKGKNAIYHVVDMMNKADELHAVISPEGWITRRTKWNKGFWYMAQKAQVPIVVTTIDYEKKEMGIRKVIHDTSDFDSVIRQLKDIYKDIQGKNPDQFALHEEDECKAV